MKTLLEIQGIRILLQKKGVINGGGSIGSMPVAFDNEHGVLWLEALDAPTEALGWCGGAISIGKEGSHVDDEALLQSHKRMEHGDLWLEALDAPTEALGWCGGAISIGKEGSHVDDETLLQSHKRMEHGDLWLEALDAPTEALGWCGGAISIGKEGSHVDDETLLQSHKRMEHGDLWLEALDAPTEALGWCGGAISIGKDGSHVDDETLLQSHRKMVVCLLHLSNEYSDLWLEALDAPTEALGWCGGAMSIGKEGSHLDDETLLQSHKRMVVCLLHLNKEHGDLWLEALDAPTEALEWCGGAISVGKEGSHVDDETLLQSHKRMTTTGPALSSKEQDLLRGCLQDAAAELVKSEGLLNRLDSGCGDGDCGNTLKKFGLAIQSYLTTASLEYPANILWDLSEIAETDMGGTSGGIYSLGLAAASQTVANAKSNNVALWLSAWESAMQAISKYGGAEPGDRTMLDTLHAAAEVYKQNLSGDFKTLLKKTSEAADRGAKATANMTAKAGRASYVASGYTHDEDAGARAAAIWLQAIFSHIANKY
ncbi:DAK2 domain-containing protein [Phthorimaea operculella]|nr:DAK2 domain-containing protein [Phthorimaea operculella]